MCLLRRTTCRSPSTLPVTLDARLRSETELDSRVHCELPPSPVISFMAFCTHVVISLAAHNARCQYHSPAHASRSQTRKRTESSSPTLADRGRRVQSVGGPTTPTNKDSQRLALHLLVLCLSLSLVLVLQVVSFHFPFLVLRFLSSALKFLVLPSDPSSSQDTSVQRRLRQQMPTRSHRYATNADRILIPVRISPFWDWCLPGCRVLSAADSHLAQRLG